jgi:hypothetical protein
MVLSLDVLAMLAEAGWRRQPARGTDREPGGARLVLDGAGMTVSGKDIEVVAGGDQARGLGDQPRGGPRWAAGTIPLVEMG